MRVFLAVDLRTRSAGLARLHATRHFLGEIDRAALATRRAARGERLAEPPFDVTLRAGGTFPATGRPRVLWLGIDGGLDPLRRVHAWLQPRIAGIGQRDRHDSFSPHLTIARVRRDTMPGLGRALRDAAARTPVPRDTTRVASVTLMESVLSPTGPTYRPVAVFPLGPDVPSSG